MNLDRLRRLLRTAVDTMDEGDLRELGVALKRLGLTEPSLRLATLPDAKEGLLDNLRNYLRNTYYPDRGWWERVTTTAYELMGCTELGSVQSTGPVGQVLCSVIDRDESDSPVLRYSTQVVEIGAPQPITLPDGQLGIDYPVVPGLEDLRCATLLAGYYDHMVVGRCVTAFRDTPHYDPRGLNRFLPSGEDLPDVTYYDPSISSEWLLDAIARASSLSHRRTRQRPFNWLVTHPTTARQFRSFVYPMSPNGAFGQFCVASSEVRRMAHSFEDIDVPLKPLHLEGALLNKYLVWTHQTVPEGYILGGSKARATDSSLIMAAFMLAAPNHRNEVLSSFALICTNPGALGLLVPRPKT